MTRSAPTLFALAVLLLGLAGPWIAPQDPLSPVAPVGLQLLPPGSRLTALVGADGSLLPLPGGAAAGWHVEGSEVVVSHAGADRRLPLAALARDADGTPRSVTLRFPLGTDRFGRDLFSRLLAGGRVSLMVGLLGLLGASAVALALGLAAGLTGGLLDSVLSRLGDSVLSIPRIVLVMVLAAWLRPSAGTLALLLAVTGWPPLARLVRAEARVVARSEMIAAARAAGAGPWRRAVRHALPTVLATLAVAAGLRFGPFVLLEASLSFLGFGVPPPAPSWGNLIADGREVLLEAWWVATFPGLALAAAVLAANLLADDLAARTDPRRPSR